MTAPLSWPLILGRLIEKTALDRASASWAMNQIMSGDAAESQIGGFMIGLRAKGESIDELAGLVDTMLSHAFILNTGPDAVDIVGTGGDLVGTVNVSSMASIVVAASGIPVMKHGSRSASGKTGSSEMLEVLGIRLDLSPERIADIVRGIAEACSAVGVALVGGETAEHPGLLGVDDYDVAGAAVGVVDAAKLLGPQNVRVGDVVLGMASSGLHSNGYSLVRKIVRDKGFSYTDQVPEFAGISLGEKLLEPTALYTGVLNTLLESELGSAVHAMSHITGGGIAANIARVLPQGVALDVHRSTWAPQEVFKVLAGWGGVWLRKRHHRTGY